MPGSTTSFLFADINVWVALTHGRQVHHLVVRDWFESLEAEARFCFCRFTQLGLLRLLTAEAVMGDEVMHQAEAWAVYDRWLEDDRVSFVEESQGIERRFRARTRLKQAAPKAWADAPELPHLRHHHRRIVGRVASAAEPLEHALHVT